MSGENVLSNREIDVARLIGEGEYLQAIADRLFISYQTVANYRYIICEKLSINRCTHAIAAWWHTEGKHLYKALAIVMLLSATQQSPQAQIINQTRRQRHTAHCIRLRCSRARKEQYEVIPLWDHIIINQ